MKCGVFILAAILPGVLLAQEVAPIAPVAPGAEAPGAKRAEKPSTVEAAQAFAVQAPDEGSPFFTEREEAKAYLGDAAQQQQSSQDGLAIYPRTKGDANSAGATFVHFFTDMFSSVKIGSLKTEPTTDNLAIDPSSFSLKDKHEVDAIFSVRNNTNKIMRLNYTTTQRFEVVSRDASGEAVFKSSDEHTVAPQEGIVIINPKERIQYEQPVATREMKPAKPYVIEANVTGYPEYTASGTVTPLP